MTRSAVQVGPAGERFYLLDIDAELVELPEDLYLRDLWDLDPADASELRGFMEEFGPPTPEVATSRLGRPKSVTGDVLPVTGVVALKDLQAGVYRLRNLVRCWDHLTGGLDMVDLQEDWEGKEDKAPRQAKDCGAYLRHLQPALECFRPLVLGPEDDWPMVGTYSALAAQIFNRVVSGEGFWHCEEETCGRPFIRYVSRTTRTRSNPAKARFCSQRCSDRFFNREFRHRERAQKLKARGLSEREIGEKMDLSLAEVKILLQGVSKKG